MTHSSTLTMENFFRLTNWHELHNLLDNLEHSIPFEAALRYYGNTWPVPDDLNEPFSPGNFVSSDLTAIYLNDIPVIFQGTNKWSEKLYYPIDYFQTKLGEIFERCLKIRSDHKNSRICMIVVPEKDFVISAEYLAECRFDAMREAFSSLKKQLEEIEISLVFDGPLRGMERHLDVSKYRYPDTHLHPRNYIVVFAQALKALGYKWSSVAPNIEVASQKLYLDLSGKFDELREGATPFCEINFLASGVKQISGSDYFEQPLGQTEQIFSNRQAIIKKDILILGDSHSSIYEQRRLTYLFANCFQRTKFSWNPAGIRQDVSETTAEHIVLEISQRFLF